MANHLHVYVFMVEMSFLNNPMTSQTKNAPFSNSSAAAEHGRWRCLFASGIRYPRSVIAFCVAFSFCIGTGIPRLHVIHNTRVFFQENHPDYLYFQDFEKTFGKSDSLVIAVSAGQQDLFSPAGLNALAAATESAWDIPYAGLVLSLANAPFVTAENDLLKLDPLFTEVDGLAEADFARIRHDAMQAGALDQRLISPCGNVAAIYVSFNISSATEGAEPIIADAAQQLARTIRDRYPGIDVYLTGSTILGEAFGEASRRDLQRLVPVVLLVMTAVLVLALRSVYAVIISVAVVLLSVMTALGAAGWVNIPLTAVSVSGPVLIVTLTVANSVHLLGTLLHLLNRGDVQRSAVLASLQTNLQAVFMTSATTAIGFFCLNFSESPPFRDLGNIVGIGVSAGLLFSVFFLPAIASLTPFKVVSPRSLKTDPWGRLAACLIRYHRWVLAGLLTFTLAAAGGIYRIVFDDRLIDYFSESFQVRRDTDFVASRLGGGDTIDYVFEAPAAGGIIAPDALTVIDRFVEWQREQPNVVSVYAITDMLRQMDRYLQSRDEGRLPDSRAMAAQSLFLYELALPAGQELAHWVNLNRTGSRVSVVYRSLGTRHLVDANREAIRWFKENGPDALTLQSTGLSLLWAGVTHRNSKNMLLGTMVALVLISFLLGLSLRHIRTGVISLIPNLLPPLAVFGLRGWLNMPFGLALSAVGSMTIGIVVDDTFFLLIHYQRVRTREGLSPAAALTDTFRAVGKSLCITTAALVSGFLVLLLSPYRMSSQVGLLCAVILVLALALDLLLLPSLLMWLDKDR